jgi:hypothetical protein
MLLKGKNKLPDITEGIPSSDVNLFDPKNKSYVAGGIPSSEVNLLFEAS